MPTVSPADRVASRLGHIYGAGYSPDGRRIVSCGDDATVQIWDSDSGMQLAVLRGHQYRVMSASFSPDGYRIVSSSLDNTVRIWDAYSGAQLAVLCGHERTVEDLRFSPDGRRIVSSSRDETTRVWDASTGECLKFIRGRKSVTGAVPYSPQSNYGALVGELETVIEDSVRRQTVAWYPEHLSPLTTHPSGRLWAGAVRTHVHIFKLEGECKRNNEV